MLTREIMGGLALAILWVNTLLIAAAALKQANEHRRRLRALRPLAPGQPGEGLFAARIVEGDGPAGALARHEVEQLGRAGDPDGDRRTIHFADRKHTTSVLGGVAVFRDAADVRVRVPAGEGDVWPDPAGVRAAAACPDRTAFDAAFEEARKARGHARVVRTPLPAGRDVWLAGELARTPDGWTLSPGADAGLLVSAIEPRAWLRKKAALALAFALAEVAVAAGITALAFVPPLFDGWPCKIAGMLGLGFFLGVQPLGNAVRDALRTPGKAFLRGRWIEPAAPAAGIARAATESPPGATPA